MVGRMLLHKWLTVPYADIPQFDKILIILAKNQIIYVVTLIYIDLG